MDPDVAGELLARPFPVTADYCGDWLEGVACSGPESHFAPIAVFASLYETPAADDGSIGDIYAGVFDGFARQRRDLVAALTTVWGPPESWSWHDEAERIFAGDGDGLPALVYDLALFAGGGEPVPVWRHGDRVVLALIGMMDKEFPIVFTLAVVAAGVLRR